MDLVSSDCIFSMLELSLVHAILIGFMITTAYLLRACFCVCVRACACVYLAVVGSYSKVSF